jgi:hypothetical protein
MTKCLKHLFLQIEETTVYSVQRYLLSTTRWHSVIWPNSFWDMTKCLKPYFCKLKKQQCIPRNATCWAQRVDNQVDWPNSFRDMTKFLKPYFCKLKKQQCIPRNSFWDMTKWFKNLIFSNWRNNSVFGAALPADHNALTLSRLAK